MPSATRSRVIELLNKLPYPFGVILPQPASLVTAGWEACGTTWESCEPNVPKARRQMDGVTLEINRCCTDPRYADVCSNLYARTIRIGREMGYTRFLTYTLPEESGSSLRAVGFQLDGTVHGSSHGWDSPSRPRTAGRYPSGDKLRWVLLAP